MDGRIDDVTLHAAARWQARLRAMDCTEQERAAFFRWRDEHPLHARACELAEKTSRQLDRLMLDERIQELTARALASAGVCVCLLDRARFPRNKPCGGAISVRALKIAAREPPPEAASTSSEPIR